MTDELGQLDKSQKPFRWWLIPAIVAGFIGILAAIAGAMIACSMAYEFTMRRNDVNFPWVVMAKGSAAVLAYLTLGGCLLTAATEFWRSRMKAGLILVAVGVLAMSLAVMIIT